MTVIKPESLVKRSDEPVSAEIGSEVVILSVQQGHYYATEAVGKRIWDLLGESIKVKSICDIMMEEFDVERAVCEEEVITFLSQLNDEGLLLIL